VLSSRSYLAIGNQPGFFLALFVIAPKRGYKSRYPDDLPNAFCGSNRLDSFQQHVSLQYMTSAWPEKGTSTYHHHCPQYTMQDRWMDMDGWMDGWMMCGTQTTFPFHSCPTANHSS